jgi:hypothetical protein
MLAAQGRVVGVGGFTVLGPNNSLIRPEYRGVGYSQLHGMEHVLGNARDNKDDLFAVVLLTEDELEVAGRFGFARVLARMGRAARFYPYPLWNTLDEERKIRREWIAASVVGGLGAVVTTSGLMPLSHQGRVFLRTTSEAAEKLAAALSQRRGSGLLAPTTDGWKEAPHCMVWTPDLTGPTAISQKVKQDTFARPSAPDDIMLGCFMGFIASKSKQGAMGVEDGYIAFLSSDSWDRLILALRTGSDFELSGTGGKFVPFAIHKKT